MSHAQETAPPWNFSWVVENKLAAMGFPKTKANIRFLAHQGVRHLITLSPEKIPPVEHELDWTLIPLEEFEAPDVQDVVKFIDVCQRCRRRNEPVGVHCRMGLGRTGVMLACYMVYFYGVAPERAIINVRRERPGSIETYSQEKAVVLYRDYLRSQPSSNAASSEDGKK